MRTTKFRIWNPVEKKMVESGATSSMLSIFFYHTATLDTVHKMPYQQFTGLHDRNGKEIYEGDICRMVYEEDEGGGWHSDKKVRGKVYFDAHWGVKFDCRDGTQRIAKTHWSDDTSAVRDYRNVEVIGNIYENPELLK